MINIADELIAEKLAEVRQDLDDWVTEQMNGLVLAAAGIEHHPRVREILSEQQTKLAAWRAEKLAILESKLLDATGRLH